MARVIMIQAHPQGETFSNTLGTLASVRLEIEVVPWAVLKFE